jgi:uncharacterized LabA/DUF88 family protein
MKDRVIIYIDASNLYLRSKEVCGDGRINLKKFVRFLANDRPLLKIKYFCVEPPEPNRSKFCLSTSEGRAKYLRATEAYAKTISWYTLMKDWKLIELIHGRLQRTGDGRLQEKGVDVALALNLVVDSALPDHETSIVVSGDADLVMAVNIAKQWGKRVEGAAFEPCYHIAQSCDSFIILNERNMYDFLVINKRASMKPAVKS